MPCKIGLQWAAMWGLFRNYPPWLKLPCKSGLPWAAMGGLFRNYHPWKKLPCICGLQCAEVGGLFRNYPLTEIAMYKWAAINCKERTFQELPPDWNCHVRVGCNGLQREDFSGITPWLKMPCKSGLQWAAKGGFSGITTPERNCHVCVGCNALQWEDFSEITPWLKLPCKSGLQWSAMAGLFRIYPPD